jgi:DegV family protein with EDD domain
VAALRWSWRKTGRAGSPDPEASGDSQSQPADVRVLTDSTAYLDPDVAAENGVEVVPLEVTVGGVPHLEGHDITSADLAAALRKWTPVSTSRPSPARLLGAYEKLIADGATEIVSVHLSGDMSGTCDAARLAARDATVPVHVVDSRLLGMGLGYAALAAAHVAADGADGATVATAASERAAATRAFFYVDTLEHLRRGGRIGAAQALIGSALAVKPLLGLDDGRIVPLEKVRTSARALARLEELAVEAVPGASSGNVMVDVTVHHLASPERAEQLCGRLKDRLPAVGDLRVAEIGAVVGAHVGPGMLGVVVSPAP